VIKLIPLGLVLVVGFGAWAASTGDSAPQAASQPTAVTAAPGEQTIEIDHADLSRQLSDSLVGQPIGSTPMGPATLTRIAAQLTDGHLQADGDASVASASVPVSMTASSTVQDGRAVVIVDDLRAAGVSLPSSARQSVQQALQARVDQAVDGQHLRVSQVAIGNGKLTVVGSHT
jgi:hypothetical protein